jgi:peptide/nickel transport system substrate-binding protein
VILRYIQEASAQRAALESGEIDVAYDFTPDAFKAAETDERFTALRTDTFQMQYLGMNSGEGSPFADNRVRQAVRYALDQDGIVDGLWAVWVGRCRPSSPPGSWARTRQFSTSTTKGAPANSSPKPVLRTASRSNTSCRPAPAAAACPAPTSPRRCRATSAAVGIQANITQTVQAELLDIYRAQNAELVMIQWSPDFPDPDGNATHARGLQRREHRLAQRLDNPRPRRLGAGGRLETDPAARAALYEQLTTLVAEEGPYAILFQPFKPS